MLEILNSGIMKKFNNIKIVPYSELLDGPMGLSFHKGGPIWPDWENQNDMRSCRGGEPADSMPDTLIDNECELIETPLFWCGAITTHFGHQIADFTSRIVNYDTSQGKLCFAVHPRTGIRSVLDSPDFFKEILTILRVDLSAIYIVYKPILAKELYCVPQSEQLGGPGPDSQYLEKLSILNPALIAEKKSGIYYISRAAQKTGKVAGESYLESYLGLKGVKVIRPETISVEEQIKIYRKAKTLIFCEGSAVHGLQLLGHIDCEVIVINRRPNSTIAYPLIKDRVKSLKYINVGELVCGLNKFGDPAIALGICIPKLENVLELLSTINISAKDFNENLFSLSCSDDLNSWLNNEKKTLRGRAESLTMIMDALVKLGIPIP